MAKIKSVKVWGFYSYNEPQTFDLSEGLTVITGPTDAGKTTVIRAIRWVAFGEPAGESFIHTKRDATTGQIVFQAAEAGVEINMDDGRQVIKTRRGGKTKYWVTGYTEPFMKAEVPEAVTEILGIRKQQYSDFEASLNFAYQLDPPFLISQTASAGAKVLAKLAGVEVVDGAIKSVSKDQYAARQDKTAAEKAQAKAEEALQGYEDLGDVRAQLEAAEVLLQQIEEARKWSEDVQTLFGELNKAEHRLNVAQNTLDALANLPDLWDDIREIEKAQQRYDALLDLFHQFGKATATVEFLNEQLRSFEGLEYAKFILQDLEEEATRFDTLRNLGKEYHTHSANVKAYDDTLQRTAGVKEAKALLESAAEDAQRAAQLRTIAGDYAFAQGKLARVEFALASVNAVAEAKPLLVDAEKEVDRLQQLHALRIEYHAKNQTLDIAEGNLQKAAHDIAAAKAELSEVFSTLKVCPTCGQEVTSIDHLSH